ncbi:hypothetical protein Riv7116_6925 (plasmid) [Rivularia sp. PCC 7116]|nr:hypothetical protein Riv7116_6925 [Rivularia sp. PCC 7116]
MKKFFLDNHSIFSHLKSCHGSEKNHFLAGLWQAFSAPETPILSFKSCSTTPTHQKPPPTTTAGAWTWGDGGLVVGIVYIDYKSLVID